MEDVNRRLRRRCRLGALDPAEADLGLRDGAALRRGDGGLDGLEPELEIGAALRASLAPKVRGSACRRPNSRCPWSPCPAGRAPPSPVAPRRRRRSWSSSPGDPLRARAGAPPRRPRRARAWARRRPRRSRARAWRSPRALSAALHPAHARRAFAGAAQLGAILPEADGPELPAHRQRRHQRGVDAVHRARQLVIEGNGVVKARVVLGGLKERREHQQALVAQRRAVPPGAAPPRSRG